VDVEEACLLGVDLVAQGLGRLVRGAPRDRPDAGQALVALVIRARAGDEPDAEVAPGRVLGGGAPGERDGHGLHGTRGGEAGEADEVAVVDQRRRFVGGEFREGLGPHLFSPHARAAVTRRRDTSPELTSLGPASVVITSRPSASRPLSVPSNGCPAPTISTASPR